MTEAPFAASRDGDVTLARKLGTVDATLIAMGGIVGSGVFVTPPSWPRVYTLRASVWPASPTVGRP